MLSIRTHEAFGKDNHLAACHLWSVEMLAFIVVLLVCDVLVEGCGLPGKVCHNALSCKVCMDMLVVLIRLCVVFGHHHGVSGCRLMGAGAVVFLLAQRGKTAHMVMVTVQGAPSLGTVTSSVTSAVHMFTIHHEAASRDFRHIHSKIVKNFFRAGCLDDVLLLGNTQAHRRH